MPGRSNAGLPVKATFFSSQEAARLIGWPARIATCKPPAWKNANCSLPDSGLRTNFDADQKSGKIDQNLRIVEI